MFERSGSASGQERGRGDGDDGGADVEALAERPVPVRRERERGVRGGDRERACCAVRDDRDVRRVARRDVCCGRAKRGGEGGKQKSALHSEGLAAQNGQDLW